VAAEIARQCCLALEYAHGLTATDGTPLNIVHRDVTPANIVVAFDGTVKLLDFGVARTVDPARRSHTDAGVLKGKLAYAAPEQIRSHDVDGRCDLFSLGVVLHELLTWRRLFYAKSDTETLSRVLEHPIPLPSSKNRAVSPALDRIVMKALERDRSLRYQSAGDMADDLERYLLLSRHSGRVMRRLMRNVFEPVWREHDPPDEADTALEPPESSNRTLDAASCIIEVAEPVTPNSASAPVAIPRRRWPALALAASLAAALLSIGAAARRSLTTPAARETASVVTPPTPAPSVSVSIDSVPQGALIYADPAAPPLGETPLVVTLVKSRHVVSYTLSKNDYDVAVVKIIPDQDKPVLVQLAAATSRLRTGRAVLRLRAGASLARK
jgi:serine/threonine-protein kinase